MTEQKKQKKVKLQVVKTEADYDPEKVLGKEMFPELYSNIYIAGKKKSGKTQLVFNILKKCANKATKVMIFSATVNKDATYKEIIKMLDKKGIDHMEYEHFIDEDGTDLLAEFIAKAKEQAEEENGEDYVPAPPTSRKYVPLEEARIIFGDEVPRKELEKKQAEADKKAEEAAAKAAAKKAKRKGKGKLVPEYILVFDDLGEDLRKKAVSQLLIKNRHFKCKTICLSQWITYLPPTAIRQLDYVILFGGFNGEKLEDLHVKLDLSDSFEHFERVYKNATAKKYHFLYIDIANNEYRNDFNDRVPEYTEPESV
jgi:hypothetical protein